MLLIKKKSDYKIVKISKKIKSLKKIVKDKKKSVILISNETHTEDILCAQLSGRNTSQWIKKNENNKI